MYGKGPKKSRPRKKSRARVYKLSSKPTKAFTKNVKAVIHTLAENKIFSNYAANNSLVIAQGATTPYTLGLLPGISQGVTVQDRVGNQVNLTTSRIRYAINLLPYNAITNPYSPLYVKMWVVSLKIKQQSQGVPVLADYNKFFQVGNTTLGFQGNTLDSLFDINKDVFTLHCTRVHTLGTVSGTGSASNNTYGGSNNPQARGVIELAKYVKSLKYDDATALVTNKNLWLFIQPVTIEGTTGTGYIPAEFHYSIETQYEDM